MNYIFFFYAQCLMINTQWLTLNPSLNHVVLIIHLIAYHGRHKDSRNSSNSNSSSSLWLNQWEVFFPWVCLGWLTPPLMDPTTTTTTTAATTTTTSITIIIAFITAAASTTTITTTETASTTIFRQIHKRVHQQKRYVIVLNQRIIPTHCTFFHHRVRWLFIVLFVFKVYFRKCSFYFLNGIDDCGKGRCGQLIPFAQGEQIVIVSF